MGKDIDQTVSVDVGLEAVLDPAKKQFRIMFLVESPVGTSSRDLSMLVEKALRDAGHEPVASQVGAL